MAKSLLQRDVYDVENLKLRILMV